MNRQEHLKQSYKQNIKKSHEIATREILLSIADSLAFIADHLESLESQSPTSQSKTPPPSITPSTWCTVGTLTGSEYECSNCSYRTTTPYSECPICHSQMENGIMRS